MSYGYEYSVAAQSAASDRAAFIRRTYAHLAGAILAFMGLEAVLLNVVEPRAVFGLFAGTPASMLIILLAFMGASYLAQVWARSDSSPGLQYLGLGLYVVAQAVIFLPILIIATKYLNDPTLVPKAAILTLAVFGGLTLSVFMTRKDYSFLAPILSVSTLLALGLIVAAILFGGFNLGLWFSFAMVALMSGYILYDTSNVIHHYRTDQHVAAALALFAAVATLFYYVLRILMAFSSRD
jgi:FtsH-binding integral membrane protein